MWEQNIMGLTDSSYHEFQAVTWSKCIAMGDRLDSNNPFSWEKVVLNLPGTEEYYFQRTWVFMLMVDSFMAQ